MGPDGPKWGKEDFLPTDPDLADILGALDFDSDNLYFLDFLGSQTSIQKSIASPEIHRESKSPSFDVNPEIHHEAITFPSLEQKLAPSFVFLLLRVVDVPGRNGRNGLK